MSEKIAFGLDTVTVVATALLQLPARSWTRRLNRTAPGVIAAVGTEATAAPLTKLTETRVPLPTPGSVVPVQNSAVWNAVSAVTGADRVSRAAPFVGLGDPVRVPSAGAVLSTTRGIANRSPQLPASSRPRT